MKLKIFEIGSEGRSKEWVAAYTNIGAIKTLCSDTGMGLWDIEEDTVTELPEEKWDSYHVNDENGDRLKTFREALASVKTPEIIASTEI